jgi:hypothetical protein
VSIPDERLQELRARALAANLEPVGDPGELARRGIRGHLASVTPGLVAPDRPEVDVRLHGPGVPGAEVPVREATAILNSVQEAVASIGQALRYEPTLRGVIQGQVLVATELRMTPIIRAGSVGFHLVGSGEPVTGNEAAGLVGTDTLVDAAMKELFGLVEQSASIEPESSALAQELRKLGPRTAKHLSDLVKRVINDEIDIDLTWRTPSGRRRQTSLQRPSAQALERAIALNKVDTQIVEIVGDLVTISTAIKAEIKTDDGRIAMAVGKDLAATLGPLYNQRVVATAERVTTWNTNTGKESRVFQLMDIRLANPKEAASTGIRVMP